MPVAFITGASRGIGRELAQGFAKAGWDLGLTATNESALDGVCSQIRKDTNVNVAVRTADVRDFPSVEAAVSFLVEQLGAANLLINNAGRIDAEVPIWEADPADLASVVETNILGTLYMERATTPFMLESGGRIINLVSGAGARSWGLATAYTASKAAQLRNVGDITDSGRSRGLLAFGVAPGVVRTDMTEGMDAHATRTDFTPAQATTDLALAIAQGQLDAWAGRYLRADIDTPESLIEAQETLENIAGAREFGVSPWGSTDPLS